MPKWEYTVAERRRSVIAEQPESKKTQFAVTEWNWDVPGLLAAMEEGEWELVTVVSRASHVESDRVAGVTTEEDWILRRPAELGTALTQATPGPAIIVSARKTIETR